MVAIAHVSHNTHLRRKYQRKQENAHLPLSSFVFLSFFFVSLKFLFAIFSAQRERMFVRFPSGTCPSGTQAHVRPARALLRSLRFAHINPLLLRNTFESRPIHISTTMATNVDTTTKTPKERKYSPEQLQAEIDRPRKKAGRPRKYATEEERKRVSVEDHMRIYWRKKNAAHGVENPQELALRKHMCSSDEERAERQRAACLRYYYSHRDSCLLSRTSLAVSRREGTVSQSP